MPNSAASGLGLYCLLRSVCSHRVAGSIQIPSEILNFLLNYPGSTPDPRYLDNSSPCPKTRISSLYNLLLCLKVAGQMASVDPVNLILAVKEACIN